MHGKNPRALRPTLIRVRDVLELFARRTRRVRLLQVGANDGVYDDPVHEYVVRDGWQAVMVEPLRNVCETKLRATYAKCPAVRVVNCAVAAGGGTRALYRLSFSDESWATGLTSFERASLEHHIECGYVAKVATEHGVTPPARVEDWITAEHVAVHTPAELLEQHGFDGLEILVIDTEGFDFEVLKLLDWQRHRPQVVLFESKHLSDADFVAAQRLLREHGYRLYWQKGNTLAIGHGFRLTWLEERRSRWRAFFEKL